MRSPRWWVLAVVVALAAANVWVTFRRSGIPASLDGTVDRIEVRPEKHPGLDDVHLVTIAGKEVPPPSSSTNESNTESQSAFTSRRIQLYSPAGKICSFIRNSVLVPVSVAKSIVFGMSNWKLRCSPV